MENICLFVKISQNDDSRGSPKTEARIVVASTENSYFIDKLFLLLQSHIKEFLTMSVHPRKCFFFFFISPLKIQLKKDTNLQNYVPPKAGKDTESSSPHFEWHLQIFNYIVLKVQTSLAPNNAKNKLCFSFEKNKKKIIFI